jgi:transposase
MPKTYKITHENAVEARNFMDKTTDAKIQIRLLVIALRGEGRKNPEIAQITGFAPKYIPQIISTFVHSGFSALLTDNRQGGNRRNVSVWEEQKFLKSWKQKAEKGKITSAKEMRLAYQDKFGVTITESAFLRLIKRHGWRKIEPKKQHQKVADAQTQRASKKLNQNPDNLGKRFIWMVVEDECELCSKTKQHSEESAQ